MAEKKLKLQEIEKNIIARRAYESIKQAILNREIDNKINQEEIAKMLNVSRTPVVIALNQLKSEGYLIQIPHRGFFIRKVNEKELKDLNEIRKLYENLAVEKLIANLGDAEIAALKQFSADFRNFQSKSGTEDYRKLDISFHKYLCRQSDNNYIIENHDYIMNRYTDFLPLKNSISHHQEIIRRVLSRDLKGAKKIVTHHIDSVVFNDF